ncbi:MAG: ABC transporter permease [Gemmatimonadales bacterium]|jgi:putative ABC transport system permease protein
MPSVLQDVRYAFRMLRKAPGFTALAVVTLALGIGVNTTIFSVVNAVILKPLPYEDADRLAFIMESHVNSPFISVAYLNYLHWKAQSRSFDQMAIVRGQTYNLTGVPDPERIMGAHVSANMFTTLGVQPLLGRTFEQYDDHPAATPVAVLSYGIWQRRFGGEPSILGQTLTLNGISYAIVGVLPRDFKWFLQHQRPEIWTPIGLWADTPMLNQRDSRSGMNVIARLREGVTIEQATADLASVARRLEEQYPDTNAGRGVRAMSLQERVVGDTQRPLFILLGAVGLVLLIACANVANLLLVRATGRTREFAVRSSLGAGRWRLTRQLLTESVMLALTGGVLGILAAYWSIDLLRAVSPADLPRLDEVGIDRTVLGFSLVLALLTGGLFGLAPALQSSRPDLHSALKEGGRGSTAGSNPYRSTLVVAEVAFALVLLIAAGLLVKSFWRLQTESPGFNPDNVLTAQIVLTGPSYADADARRAFYHGLLERLQSLPGVQAASLINPLPVTGTGWQTRFMIEGRPRPDPGEFPSTEWMQISPGYFRTMEIPLLRGRTFNEFDHENARSVVIIDEKFASSHFPDVDPIGQRIAFGDLEVPIWREIVGVVGHVKLSGVAEEAAIEMYMPYLQGAYAPISVILRTTGDPTDVVPALRAAVLAIDTAMPLYNIRTMRELLNDTVVARRLAMTLLTIFAGLALALVTLGIYGVVSYHVSQRTHEIGIRMALGADRTNVLGLAVRQGATLTLIGLAVGLAAACGLTRILRGMLFDVEPTDPLTFGLITVFLAVVGLVAAYIPARRATRVDPLAALQYE